MKINSNTISLDRDDYAALEDMIKKIASENKIEDVNEVHISLDQNKGMISFKTAGELVEIIEDKKEDKE